MSKPLMSTCGVVVVDVGDVGVVDVDDIVGDDKCVNGCCNTVKQRSYTKIKLEVIQDVMQSRRTKSP